MSTRPGPPTTPRPGPPTFGLAPDKEQAALLKRYFGVSRFAYNWVLYANREERVAGEDLRTRFEEAVAKEAPWVREVPVAILDASIRQAERDLSFLRGKGRRPRYRRKEDDASVRIDADAEGFRIGQGGVQLPEVGKLSLVGGNSRIGGAVEAVVILLAGEDWKVQFILARGGRRERNDNRPDRDRDLPSWQRRGEGERIDALPESVQLVREADDGTKIVTVGSGVPAAPEAPAPAEAPPAEGAAEPVEPAGDVVPETAAGPTLPTTSASEPEPELIAAPASGPVLPGPRASEAPSIELVTEAPAEAIPVVEAAADSPVAEAAAATTGWEALTRWVTSPAVVAPAAEIVAIAAEEPVQAAPAPAVAKTGWEALERWVK